MVQFSQRILRNLLLAGAGAIIASGVAAKEFGEWSAPVNAESLSGSSPNLNTSSNDGCPILSPYDDSLYIASNRPNGEGGLDIWIARRSGDGWATPVNSGPGINTAADEFCPSPARGNRLFFVRRLSATNTDIYVARNGPKGFGAVQSVGAGVNGSAEEWSPSWFETESGNEVLYFSSTREGRQRIYYSVDFGPASLAQGGVNSSAADARPNVRRDGLEIVFDSTRGGLTAPDIFTATRSTTDEPWGTAVAITQVNSAAGESRASLSWDGTRLMFGSTRTVPGSEGSADIYTATREKVTGGD